MRFNELTPRDKKEFKEIWLNNERSEALRKLSARFRISERSVYNWLPSLGLNLEDNIEVVDAEVIDHENDTKYNHNAKILVFDLETMPLRSFIWGVWKQSIGHNMKMLENDWFMASWAAKWLFEDEVKGDVLTPIEAINQDDSRIMKSLWELIDQADIIIAHNLIKFDEKRMNTRFLLNGLTKPSPYQRIDTLLHARKKFAMSSNRLDYLGEVLGVGKKMETGGIELWIECYKGNPEALQKMLDYNVRDITLLEDVYLAMRPYIQPHPNLGLWIEDDVNSCPTCGSEDLKPAGTYATSANLYEAVKCGNCGAIGRNRTGKIPAKNKSNLLMPPAR